MATKDITEADFEQTISGEGITLVDFWADWCGPCKQFAPTYERVSEQHPDVTFAKVDTEANPMLSGQLQITAIPTLMAFRDGIQVFSQAGALPAKQLEQLVEQVKGLDMDEVRKQVAENEQSQG